MSPFIVAELDRFVLTPRCSPGEHVVFDELTSNAWDLAPFSVTIVRRRCRLLLPMRLTSFWPTSVARGDRTRLRGPRAEGPTIEGCKTRGASR